MPPAGSASTSSLLARTTPSSVPTFSRWTGPMVTTTPISGRVSSASSAICPNPRIASSVMQICVSGSSRQSVRGTPISLLKLRSAATVGRCGIAMEARMSLVVVLPYDPVMATTRACERARTARPSAAIAANTSRGTSVAAAARSSASSTNCSPWPTATKRSPFETRRESTCTPVISAAPSRTASSPMSSPATSSSESGITSPPAAGEALRGRPHGRRKAPCVRP